MRKIGVLGATFDPIHNGHLTPALEVMKQLDLNEVWLIPNKSPPYKNVPIASNQQRMDMISLAIQPHPKLLLCDTEIKKDIFCYTVDSLAELKKKYADDIFFFLMGQDSFHQLHHWHSWRTLTDHAHIVIYSRPYADKTPINPEVEAWFKQHHHAFSKGSDKTTMPRQGYIFYLDIPQTCISSSEIRQKILANAPVSDLPLSQDVLRYIQKNHIYQ